MPASAETPLSKRTKDVPAGGTVSQRKEKFQIGEGEKDRWTPKILQNPRNPANYIGRAKDYMLLCEDEKALLSQGVKLRPGEFEPFIMGADVYKEMKQYQKATADYSRAIEMNKFRAGRAYKGRAECYKALGNTAASERDLKQSKGGEAVYR